MKIQYFKNNQHENLKSQKTLHTKIPSNILDWFGYHLGEILIIWNNSGEISYISHSIEKLLEYRVTELLGSKWLEAISYEDISYIKETLNNGRKETELLDLLLFHKNGRFLPAECMIIGFKDEETAEVYFAGVLKDITAKKETEDMMRQSEKMHIAGQLAAGVAHEIRNPLTSIKGFLELLQAGVNRKDEYYPIIMEEIEKMEKMTSELLFISKPLNEERQQEPLYSMIEDIASLLQSQANLKDIKIIIRYPIDEYIYCNRSQIKQVLVNLIKNAIEAMQEAGKITIEVNSNQEHAIINIMDEGPGIPEEILAKLGEPFFTTKKDGTGLGLMITKQILDNHGASLNILENKEKGTTFQIVFPNASVENI